MHRKDDEKIRYLFQWEVSADAQRQYSGDLSHASEQKIAGNTHEAPKTFYSLPICIRPRRMLRLSVSGSAADPDFATFTPP
jgi:hypothetical protein